MFGTVVDAILRAVCGVLAGLVTAACLLWAYYLLNEDDDSREVRINAIEILLAIGLGIMVGLIGCFVPGLKPGMAMAFMVPVGLGLMMGFIVYLMYLCGKKVGSWKDLIPLTLIVIEVTILVTNGVAMATADLTQNEFFKSLIILLPALSVVVALGFFFVTLFRFRYNEFGRRDTDKYCMLGVAIATAVVVVLMLIFGLKWSKLIPATNRNMTNTEINQPETMADVDTEEIVIEDDDDVIVETDMDDVVMTEQAAMPESNNNNVAPETAAPGANPGNVTTGVATQGANPGNAGAVTPGTNTAGNTTTQTVAPGTTGTTGNATVAAASMPAVEVTWYKFYHYELLKDENIDDDFDFGPTAYHENSTNKTVMEEHFTRIEKDPSLGAATFADFDVRLNTDFMIPGEHYDQNWSDGYWTTTINECAEIYKADQDYYKILVERWENFVRTYAEVSLVYAENVEDQMYMLTLTSQNEWETPEVIIAETDQPNGHILTYKFTIKGDDDPKFSVTFRTDCGFQPTNVATVMRETPQPNPKPTSNDDGEKKKSDSAPTPTPSPDPSPTPTPTPSPEPTPTPTPTPEPTPTPTPTPEPTPTPTPTPTPETEPKKDPSKSPTTNTQPNDDPGPGPSTNNGVGATESTADQPTNSNHMSQTEYNQAVEELKEVNKTQKTGSDSSTPSTPAPTPSTKVDNPADTGTSTAAPINTPTPEAPKGTVAGDPESVGMISAPD